MRLIIERGDPCVSDIIARHTAGDGNAGKLISSGKSSYVYVPNC